MILAKSNRDLLALPNEKAVGLLELKQNTPINPIDLTAIQTFCCF